MITKQDIQSFMGRFHSKTKEAEGDLRIQYWALLLLPNPTEQEMAEVVELAKALGISAEQIESDRKVALQCLEDKATAAKTNAARKAREAMEELKKNADEKLAKAEQAVRTARKAVNVAVNEHIKCVTAAQRIEAELQRNPSLRKAWEGSQ